MKKKFLKNIIVLSCISTAYAGEYPDNTVSSVMPNIIHATAVNFPNRSCIVLNISTRLGHLQHGNCQFETETPANETSPCDMAPYGVFRLDGTRLAEIAGKGWECGATHLKVLLGEKEILDSFKLISNDSGDFTGTEPGFGRAEW